MISFTLLFAAFCILTTSSAQTSSIAFSYVPATVIMGRSYNVTWTGGNGESILLSLLRGPNATALDSVGVLAPSIYGLSYMWEVGTDLEVGRDYALQILQGHGGVNYSGFISIEKASDIANASDTALITSHFPSPTLNSTESMKTEPSSTVSTSHSISVSSHVVSSSSSSSSVSVSVRITTVSITTVSMTPTTTTVTAPTSSDVLRNAAVHALGSAGLMIGLLGVIMFLL